MESFLEKESHIREKSFLMMVPLFALAGLIWAIVYYLYGAETSALIPGGYSLISFLSLLFFRWQKNYAVFRTIELGLILVLPCLLHLSMGNFITSSAVIIWSTLCPLGALAFHNSKAATYWLLLFIIMSVSVYFLENRIFPLETRLPDWLINLFFVLNIICVTFLSFYLLRYYVNQNELVKNKLAEEQVLLAAEREKSEKLLLNILPAFIARQLKENDGVIANEHPETTVLFADIVGFTNISQTISPARLVESLNTIFTHFDMLVEQYGLEKIKTIGDSYMAASGLTGSTGHEHLKKMADFALAISSGINNLSLDGNTKCRLRIGIDTGPVVAGVIGSKKFIYDIWGDTVNTASRMESSSEPGKIQVSEKFYMYLKEDYNFQYRGEMEIKGKGLMKLYFLTGKK